MRPGSCWGLFGGTSTVPMAACLSSCCPCPSPATGLDHNSPWEGAGRLGGERSPPQDPAPSLHVVLRGHGCLRSPGLRAAGNRQNRMPTASPPVPSCPAAGPKPCGGPDCPQPGSVREADACPACTPPPCNQGTLSVSSFILHYYDDHSFSASLSELIHSFIHPF